MTEAQSAATAPATPAPAVPGVGETLSRARCALGLSLDDVAQQLKFKSRQIEALEQERFAELPGGVFVRGMVRSYARLVKLDGESLAQRVTGVAPATPSIDDAVSFRKPIPFSDSTRRAYLGYGVASIAVLGVVAALVAEWPRERLLGAQLTFVQASRAPEKSPMPVESRQAAQKPQSAAEPVGVPLASVAPQISAAPAIPAAQAPVADARANAPAPVAAPAAAAAGREQRISLHFERTSWVEVRDAEDRVLLSSMNAGGTSRVVEGIAPLRLVIGNAQHVRLNHGDRPVDLAPYTRLDVARLTLE
jgi:cytoskeleton protein RodZ